MKRTMILIALLILATPLFAQDKPATPTLKTILLNQFKSTHSDKDWFVSVNVAIAGLTPEQANWTDGKGNHSVAQLTTHLIFWNNRLLLQFTGTEPPEFSGNNDETFSPVDAKTWPETVKKIDELFTRWEKAIESADEAKLAGFYETFSKMNAHNAYHIGQIVVMRKGQGSWDPEKGVK